MNPKRLRLGATVPLIALALAAPAWASSHREAPGITETPKVDGTDFYMFNSYESGRSGYVTLIANYLPLQDAYGGPNYFSLDPDAVYRIHIDNTGDGVEDMTFQFQTTLGLRDLKVVVGGKAVSAPFYNLGPFSTGSGDGQAGSLNVLETYTLSVVRGPVGRPTGSAFATRAGTRETRFFKPADNVGEKSAPNYADYARSFVYDFDIPGCSAGDGRVFVGQRKESFAVNLGEVFDLVNVSNPLGDRNAEPSDLEDKNITTFAVEVPASCLLRGSNTVLGGWTTAALRRGRQLPNNPSFARPTTDNGDFVQVSRLGMPLVNEVVIGLKDKNRFNSSSPRQDGQFADYVTNPTLPAVLELLYGGAGVRAPTNFPRQDLIAAFLTGIEGVNKLGGPAEMVRLNTAIPAVAAAQQNNLGALGGDNAGFPNGRRPGDDVVDAELRVAMGVLCHAFPGVFCNPADAPSGNLPFTDGSLQDASQFDSVFPYLRTPLPGSPNTSG